MGGFVSFAYGAVGRRGRHPIEGAIPLPPPLGEGLTCGRGRGWLAAVGVAVAGRADVRRADVRRWQRRVVAAAGSGGYWRVWPRWSAARRAVAAVGGGSGGQRRVVAGVAAAGVAVAGAAVAGVAAAGLVVCVVARLLGLKVWEAPAREVWARMEGMSRRGGVCWQQQRGQQQRGSSSVTSSAYTQHAVAVRSSAVVAEW